MPAELTTRAEQEYSHILSGEMTPAMAARYLREGRIDLRSFQDTLRRFYPRPDLQERLTAALRQAEPDANRETVARNVRNWLSGRSRPTDREDVFRIVFALSLSEGQLNTLLGLCGDYGVHYRDRRDAVYSWFLRTGRSYGEAKAFLDSLPPIPQTDDAPAGAVHLTRELQGAFQHIHSEEDLRACCLANQESFGRFHLRAYRYFMKYLAQLIHPTPAWDGSREPDYSIEAVMEQYLSLHMPSGRDRRGYSAVQKLIKRNWPNATALKNIRSRKEDVPRKLLLLLYVITENVVDDGYSELDEAYISMEERLEDHWYCLNAILLDCGMPPLDPRNPTDWLVLYAISAGGDEAMSERLEQVIQALFSDQTDG